MLDGLLTGRTGLAAGLALTASLGISAAARGQLMPQDVLVVYDSSNFESLVVAEYYAGSRVVPDGFGVFAGARPGVRVLDLRSMPGVPLITSGTINYSEFVSIFRTPIRNYLIENRLDKSVRCIVLTKGLPHRVRDINAGDVGDAPNAMVNQFNGQNATACSVDSELTCLWQDLNAGEHNTASDSKADGTVLNPYWKSPAAITTFTMNNNRAAKTWFTRSNSGPTWGPSTAAGNTSAKFLSGDMMLVCRLDGNTIEDVAAMIDRAQDVYLDVDTAAIVFDSALTLPDGSAGPDLDNQGDTVTYDGNDYEKSSGWIKNTEKRWNPSLVRLDTAGGRAGFVVGPLRNYFGQGTLESRPVVLLASYGANHTTNDGLPSSPDGTSSKVTYCTSFNLAAGAIMNTAESYNARALGGLGQNPGIEQGQIADFIGAGGTFAIGHVWEPFTWYLADNYYVCSNFLLGNLTWGEAAWTAIPVLSWQHVVLGDPLARVQRSSEDVNRDRAVDIEDLYAWEQGRGVRDINRSGTVDATDRNILLGVLRYGEWAEMNRARR